MHHLPPHAPTTLHGLAGAAVVASPLLLGFGSGAQSTWPFALLSLVGLAAIVANWRKPFRLPWRPAPLVVPVTQKRTWRRTVARLQQKN